MRRDDPVHRGEPQSRSLARLLRGEERVEDAVADLRRDAVPGVGHAQEKEGFRLSGLAIGSWRAERAGLHPEGERAALRHRIPGIEREVDEHLVQLRRVRLDFAATLGDLLDERTGRFQASTGGAFSPGWAIERHDARFIYAAPEVRWGIRLHRRAELSIGVAAPVLIRIEEPRWDVAQTHYVRAGDDGLGTFAAEALIGPVVVAITPGVGARYDF